MCVFVNQDLKMVILIRTDLSMSVGKKIAQGCHAAVCASELSRTKNKEIWERWFKEGQKKVVLKVKSEEELLSYYNKVKEKGMIAILIADAGLTQIEPGSNTAVGIGPVKSADIDPITGELPLY
jgi:PTH2 family peptidyl-tRNA hydrolase